MLSRQSKIETSLGLSRKTLSTDSASRDQSFPITGRNLIAESTGTFARN